MVPAKRSWRPRAGEGRHHRAVRPHHPVARRDGACGERDGARGLRLPLLIGGATTSRVHTAVKIHPQYERGQAVYVTDASRAVGVVSSLLSPTRRGPTSRRAGGSTARSGTPMPAPRPTSCAARSSGRARTAWPYRLERLPAAADRPSPAPGRFRAYDVRELVPYIDWTPFFQTWELKGRFPAILEDAEQARPRASSTRTRRRCCAASSRSAGSTRRQ
jgi:cobalamin-dependent methionine synthase I